MDRWQVLLNTIEIKISPISHNKDYRLGDMFFYESMEQWRINADMEKPKYGEKTLSVTFVHYKSNMS